MLHVYNKPTTPSLNGKVDQSHHTDQREFYQMLDYDGDVNLREKLATTTFLDLTQHTQEKHLMRC